jgi:hypothetical protein
MGSTNLVKGREYVIGKLDFSDGSVSHDCESNAKTNDALFC